MNNRKKSGFTLVKLLVVIEFDSTILDHLANRHDGETIPEDAL